MKRMILMSFYVAASLGLGPAMASDIADAAMTQDVGTLRGLVERGVDVNETQADGSTALHWAVYNEDAQAVGWLIDGGADVKAVTRDGMTPLALAAITGNAVIIEHLIGSGADIAQILRNGETVLMLAARTGKVAAIETLLDHGADIEATEILRGTTALMWAAANARAPAVQLLIARGADVGVQSAEIVLGRLPYLSPTAKSRIDQVAAGLDVSGTSTVFAIARGETDGNDELTREEAEAQAEAQAKALEEATNNDNVRDERIGGGLTALVFAVREGDMASVKALVAGGVDVNQITYFGWSPLLTAVQNRYYQLGAFLLAQGADPNIANEGGWSPLYIATDNRNIEGGDYPTRKPDMNHLDFINLLLDHDADPNLRMASSTETRTIFTHQWLHEEGATPFLRAAQSSDMVLMTLLLDHGADPHIATDQGVTPLMVAAGIGWVEGVTYEWSAAQNFQVVELLLELGADVNVQDVTDRRTALMGAAHKGRDDVVQILIDHGADPSLHDIGSRDSIHKLSGVTWQAIDYADGLVRIGVQSSIEHPQTAALLRELMVERGMDVPPAGRTLDSICIVDICK